MASRFKLEAVYAGKGDALILHHGTDAKPKWILIDGGHRRVYERFLRPRLDQLRIEFASHLTVDGRLPLDLVMLSHADQDHVLGLLDLKRHMEAHLAQDADDGGQGVDRSLDAPPVDISAMWINGFDDVTFDIPESRPAALENDLVEVAGNDRGAWMMSCLPEAAKLDDELVAWIASTGECRELRQFAAGLGQIPINQQFGGDLVRRDARGGPNSVKLAGGIQITVLGPDQARIDALRSKWQTDLTKILKKKKSKTSAFSDSSKHNLSSIMVMVERTVNRKRKRMLLTGDGRGDHLIDGLQAQGYLDDGVVHVDLFKLPHHGSDRNVKQQTFEKIIADDYVISANGEHHNPEIATLEMLVAGREKAGVTSNFNVHFTFPERAFAAITDEQAEKSSAKANQREALKVVHDWLEERTARLGTKDPLTPVFREQDQFSVTVDLVR